MSEFIDILLFGAIAVFLVYRLRSILGSTDGKIVNLKTKRPHTKFKPKIVPKNDNSEFLEGANHQLSSSQLLQSATTMYLPETGDAYIPVESSNGVTYSTVSASDTSVTVGGITITIERICEPVFDIVKVVFMNKFGALQEFHFNKKHTIGFNSTQENYESMLIEANTYSVTKHQKYVYNKQGNETLQLNTGYIDQGQFETIKQLMLSEQVWAKIQSTVYPVNVVTSSLTKKTKVNDKLVNYSLELEFAYDVVNSVR